MPNMKDYTKISISKSLHDIVKIICDERGLKMYFFEDEAIKKYIKDEYPQYEKKLEEIES